MNINVIYKIKNDKITLKNECIIKALSIITKLFITKMRNFRIL